MTTLTLVDHRLAGCQPEPLLSYLKALGILRVVGEQADGAAAGHWACDGFVLHTRLDEGELARFLLDDYRPTPVLSPWNKSSGFGREGADELGAIERSDLARLRPFREAATVARRLLAQDLEKEELVKLCRAEMPEQALAWIDASVVLAADLDKGERIVFPPLLGTGGNDGRLDFSRNFHQRVLDVVGLGKATPIARRRWLEDALDGLHGDQLLRNSPGQFDGGAAGAPNSAPSGAADGLLNPWDWVLMIEGAVLFAAGAARRLATATESRAAIPFTVEASPSGYASAASAEKSRGELWLPLWSRPARLPEVRRLFSEARADWRGRHARSALDLVRATGDLGVDRGISAFSRHVLAERNGLATVATPAGRVAVRERSTVPPLEQLDDWLAKVRRLRNPSGAVESALRAVEQAIFTVAGRGGDLLDVLQAAARLNAAVARSGGAREHVKPLRIRAAPWLAALRLESDPELRLAVSLASLRDGDGDGEGIRRLVAPAWQGSVLTPPPVAGLGVRPTTDVLAATLARRMVEVVQKQRHAEDDEQPGVVVGFESFAAAPLADVVALVRGEIDDGRLGNVLNACLLLNIRSAPGLRNTGRSSPVPAGFVLLAPFFGRLVNRRAGSGWAAQLTAGQVEPVLRAAIRRLRIAGDKPLADPTAAAIGLAGTGGPRLAAALLVPIAEHQRLTLLGKACPEPEKNDNDQPATDDQGATDVQP